MGPSFYKPSSEPCSAADAAGAVTSALGSVPPAVPYCGAKGTRIVFVLRRLWVSLGRGISKSQLCQYTVLHQLQNIQYLKSFLTQSPKFISAGQHNWKTFT